MVTDLDQTSNCYQGYLQRICRIASNEGRNEVSLLEQVTNPEGGLVTLKIESAGQRWVNPCDPTDDPDLKEHYRIAVAEFRAKIDSIRELLAFMSTAINDINTDAELVLADGSGPRLVFSLAERDELVRESCKNHLTIRYESTRMTIEWVLIVEETVLRAAEAELQR